MKNIKLNLITVLSFTFLFSCNDDKPSKEEYYEQVKNSKEYKVLMRTLVDDFDRSSNINAQYLTAKTEEAKIKMQKGQKRENINFSNVEDLDKDIKKETNESLFSGKAYHENKKAAKDFYAKYPEFLSDKEKQEFLINEAKKELNIEKQAHERLKKINQQ